MLREPLGNTSVTDQTPDQAIAVPLTRAPLVIGISRSGIYRAARDGHIRLLKHGRTTLVDLASARAFLASLPAAKVGGRAAA
jgi:hypothetical protein